MARTTMAYLIEELRGLTNAGTADYTAGTSTYWSDDQLQYALDQRRYDVFREELQMIPRYAGGGTVEYYEHMSRYEWFEETSGGSAIFYLEDAEGNDQGTALWTADYRTGKVTFAADTEGTAYYLTGRIYDINGAAADVWRRKTTQVAASSGGIDWSTDNMSVKRSQMVNQAANMAAYFDAMAWPRSVIVNRGDVDDGALK